jgi:two-component system, chemotaxis family, CheB/CheR fusion protein
VATKRAARTRKKTLVGPARHKLAAKRTRTASVAAKSGVPPSAPPPASNPPFIVAIGSSAGGLEALEAFFDALAADSGIAFLVVTHQHPTHTSLLPALLSKHTSMRVELASDATVIRANRVYLSPPGKNVAILAGTLQTVTTVAGESPHLPIDFCFSSLAQDQGERAICIVLSGTGTDGTLGLRAIKASAGMAIVQDEKSAQYAGMPHSAASTQLADYVLRPEQMPAQLMAYVQSKLKLSASDVASDDELTATLPKILVLLRARTGQDFTGYKLNTIHRRVARRMRVHQLGSASEYEALLQAEPHELDLLFKELLITVTQFFRDGAAFAALGDALTRYFAAQADAAEYSLRVWVAGCSSGEEAYSIAMLAQEVAEAAGKRLQLQIFATDLDADAVQTARAGSYPDSVKLAVGPLRLSRFFRAEGNGYRIEKAIRDCVVFATQNVLKDPPFTKLDLLSFRNVLIYLNPELQQRVFPVLHYALKPGGMLWLGTSETAAGFDDLFRAIDRKWKLYERRPTAPGAVLAFDWRRTPKIENDTQVSQRVAASASLAETMQRMLLERFAPPTAVVTDRGDIVYVHGRTGDYLELSAGLPGHNLFAMARPGLELSLPAAIRAAIREKREVVQRSVHMPTAKGTTPVNLRVWRIADPESVRGLFCVSFERLPPAPASKNKAPEGKRDDNQHRLERELEHVRGSLRGNVDELQTSNEELKSSNEELQSTNEELQSTNEELETSKEELHSLNEELQTVNAELQQNMDELARVNDDMQNLLNSTDIATLFLDRELRIKRFTDRARQVVPLIATDVGRPISDLTSHLHYDNLGADAQNVLDTLTAHESEVQTLQGQWLLVGIRPYRTSQNLIDGVVITFVNIDRIKRAELLAASRAVAQSIVQTVREPLLVLDDALRVVSINRAFIQLFRLQQVQVEGWSIFEMGGGILDLPRLRELLTSVATQGTHFEDFEFEHDFAGLGQRRISLNARRLEEGGTSAFRTLVALTEAGASPTDRLS